MPANRRILIWIGAAACWLAAFLLVVSVGLPERAQFTGRVLPGELPIAPEINAVAPPFEAVTLQGKPISLPSLRGTAVLINFWATWCVPCSVEMPDLQAVYTRYEKQGLRLIAVNLGEPPAIISPWARDLGLRFDIVPDMRQTIAALYQIRGQPSTYVVSPSGVITQIFYGPTTQDSLVAALAPFFPSG
jgi:peroxiredoxin